MDLTNSEDILTGLMRWVAIDTPTGATETIGTLIDLIAADLEPLGAALERVPGRDGMGDHLIARFAGANGPGVLITSHIDTVCPPGAVTIRRDGDRQYGPGIADMKGGGYLAFSAVRNLLASGAPLPGPVTLIYNSDEENLPPRGCKDAVKWYTKSSQNISKVVSARQTYVCWK